MKISKHIHHLFLIIPMIVFIVGCNDNPERHLDLGKWYAQKGLWNEAVLEFREVIRLSPANHEALTREQFQTLSNAHYHMAIVYTKKGWWDAALNEAKTCFDLQPTQNHYELLQLIQKRITLDALPAES